MIRGSDSASLAVDSTCALDRRPSRRQRIARDHEVVDNASTLDVARRSPRSVRIHLALRLAVVGRIRINENAGSAALLRRQRFESAIAVRDGVAHEGYPSSDVDPLRLQPVVVGRIPRSRIDDIRRDVARRGIGVVGKSDLVGRRLGIRIPLDRILTHGCAPGTRGGHFHAHLEWPRQQHFVSRYLHIFETRFGKAGGGPVSKLLVSRRAGDMRLRREKRVRLTDAIAIRQGEEAALQPLFGVCAAASKAERSQGWRLRSREGDAGNGEGCRHQNARHR